jgi:predicted Zn-dependent protease
MRPLLLVALIAGLAGCVRNPVTGKRQLSLVSEEQEIALGQQAKQEVAQSLGVVKDPELEAYVTRIGKAIAVHSERPGLPWSFQVLDDPAVNAFALPGGPIFVTRGLLTHLSSEAQLAIVLGHEVGHVTAKHAVNLLSKQQLAQVGLGVGSILLPEDLRGLGQLAQLGTGLLFLKYGRDAERQSDELAYRYALGQRYDVREMSTVFHTLGKAAGAGGRLPEWLSTHPDPENRIAAAQERVRGTPEAMTAELERGRDPYLRQIDGLAFGEDPRQGFFQGNAFLHPDLKLRVDFPSGWKAVNQPAAVIAVSPRQEAALQLGGVGAIPPEEAARRFFAHPAIQRGPLGVGQLNKLPTVAGYFQANTDQGPLSGMTAFFSQEGTTLQLIGFTRPQLLPAYDETFRQALASVGPLTDPQALAVQPARVEIVTAPNELSVAEAHAQLGGSVSLETFALINGLSMDQRVAQGTLLKRVVGKPPATQGP